MLRRRARLTVAPAEGVMEADADRLAEHMVSSAPAAAPCACHAPAPAAAIQRRGADENQHNPRRGHDFGDVDAVVEPVLAAGGHGLDAATRRSFEARLGVDLAGVRIHTDAAAARSAQALGALAYTIGRDIAFAPGQYRPDTGGGRHLLAHEVAHTVQQGAGTVIQRWAACKPARLSLLDCPPREPGEMKRAGSSPMVFMPQLHDVVGGNEGALVVNFDIGKAAIKPSLKTNFFWLQFLDNIAANKSKWELLGFTDCQGPDSLATIPKGQTAPEDHTQLNEPLRVARAEAVYDILPAAIKPRITLRGGAPGGDCITSNDSAADRTMNRSVAFRFAGYTADFVPEVHTARPHPFICGPDVTDGVVRSLAKVHTLFGGWSDDQRSDACGALTSLSKGSYAWDLEELHFHDWIGKDFNPPCATPGSDPSCAASVQVQDDCHYSGSVNYVVFGVMCRLCLDHFDAKKDSDAKDFTLDRMNGLIWFYKGPNPARNIFVDHNRPFKESGNYAASMAWADAGYRGWPAATTPKADRANCTPICPKPSPYSSYRINWVPNIGDESRG